MRGARGWLGLGEVLALAVAFGLATGLGEVALRSLLRATVGQLFRVPLQVVWMAPLANVVIFTIGAILFWGSGRWVRPLRKPRVVMAGFATLTLLAWLLIVPLNPWAVVLLALGGGWQASRLLEKSWRGDRVRQTLVALAGAVLLLALGTNAFLLVRERSGVRAMGEARAGATNVLFIIWDTVRARSMSLYGADRETTPHLESVAARGVTFTRAISTSPWTLPAHASMFTGRLPHEMSVAWYNPLDDEHATIAERLRQHGWSTAAFAANVLYVDWEHGLFRGFTHAEDFRVTPGQIMVASSLGGHILRGGGGWTPGLLRTLLGHDNEFIGRKEADHVNRDLLDWLDDREPDRPFFAFLNFFDAHLPYDPPAPFDTLFGPRRRATSFAERLDRRLEGRDKWDLSPDDLETEVRMYEASIAYLDDRLAMLLDSLEARGVLDNTLIVVTSDHGEAFGEHDAFEHGSNLYFEQTHVPLVLALPGRLPEGLVIDEPVSTRDLAATIDAIMLGGESIAMPGPSLTRFWAEPEPALGLVVSELVPGRSPDRRMTAITGAGLHYIMNMDDSFEIYDLDSDWAGLNDLGQSAGADSLVWRVKRLSEAATQCLGRCCCALPPRTFPRSNGVQTRSGNGSRP